MKSILPQIATILEKDQEIALATLLKVSGSTPQVAGASAVCNANGIIAGTVGGGVTEGEAIRRSKLLIKEKQSVTYTHDLAHDIEAKEEAICGGSALLLIDAHPQQHLDAFKRIREAWDHREAGVLVTRINGKEIVTLQRTWITKKEIVKKSLHAEISTTEDTIQKCLTTRSCIYTVLSDTSAVFTEPVIPLPTLIIAGAGHVGRALTHAASLLDFEITVLDDRPGLTHPSLLPEADHIITGNIGVSVEQLAITPETYVVIVTRGHKDDADVLKVCINTDAAYIGMIGSRKKIGFMRKDFIEKGWATPENFNRVYAPIGIEIGSQTVQEIVVSICAQMIRIRNRHQAKPKTLHITGLILAAGESKRMETPKMLLPWQESTMIQTVAGHATRSMINRTMVVIGSNAASISERLADVPATLIYNPQYRNGMLSSVHTGIRAAQHGTDAIMILLGDQPLITAEYINQIIEAYLHTERGITVPVFKGKRGHPVVFSEKYFDEILRLPDTQMLKEILHRHPEDILEINVNSQDILTDIDTREEYSEAIKNNDNHEKNHSI